LPICVLTTTQRPTLTGENAGEVLTSKIAREVYDYFEGATAEPAEKTSELKKASKASWFKPCSER